MMVNPKFAQWATSFSGCDGGNLKGSTWLCGIEYGGRPKEDDVFAEIPVPPFIGQADYAASDFVKFPYNGRAIKLLAALSGREVGEYKTFMSEKSCFGRSSDYFKLNLYPMAFRDTYDGNWPDWLARKTGLQTKKQYIDWCVEHRFPVIRSWIKKHEPKLVICTGITYASQFKNALCGTDDQMHTDSAAGKEIRYFSSNNGRTLVVIVYFLGGRHGLTGNQELAATGAKLAALNREHHRA